MKMRSALSLSRIRFRGATVKDHRAVTELLPDEPTHGIPGDVVREFQRIGIAAAIDDMSIAANHQPAKIPVAGRVSHGHAGSDSNQRMRANDEELLFGIIIR